MSLCTPVMEIMVSTRGCTPASFTAPPRSCMQAVDVHQAADGRAVDVGHGGEVDEQLARAPLHELPHLREERGQVRVGELGLLHPHDPDVALLAYFELHRVTSARPRALRAVPTPLLLLGAQQQPRELLAPAVDPALDRPFRQSEPVRHLLVAEALKVAQDHRLPQLLRQGFEAAAQEAAPVAILERAVGIAAERGRREVEGDEVLDQHFLLALAGPVVVDAEVAGDAGEPGREVGVAIELVEALEELEEDLLGQVLGVVMTCR